MAVGLLTESSTVEIESRLQYAVVGICGLIVDSLPSFQLSTKTHTETTMAGSSTRIRSSNKQANLRVFH